MIKNVYFDNIRHCLVFETGRGDGITEKVYVNGKEYNREDMDSIVEVNVYDRNEYRLYLSSDYHKNYVVTHFENYGGKVGVKIDVDCRKFHSESDRSLLKYLEDDDIFTFSWELGYDIERDKALIIGINENGIKIGFAALVEYGIDLDGRYKYARYAVCNMGIEGLITSLEGYTNGNFKANTDYNVNVIKAAWFDYSNDRTQENIIASHFEAAKKGIRGRGVIARRHNR